MASRIASLVRSALIFAAVSSLPGSLRASDDVYLKSGVWTYLGGPKLSGAHLVTSCSPDATFPDKEICFAFGCVPETAAMFEIKMQRDHYPSPAFVSLKIDGREFPLASDVDVEFITLSEKYSTLVLPVTYPEFKAFVRALQGSKTLEIPLGIMFGGNDRQEFPTEGLDDLMIKALFGCFVPDGVVE